MGLILFLSAFPPHTPTWVSLSGLIFVAVGAAWFALSPTGTQVSGSADGSSSGGSGGY